MGYIESNCPHCGKMNKEPCNTWMYGSPIRQCKSCSQKYLDRRYREVAIEGFDKRSVNASLYLKATVGFFLAFALLAATLTYFTKNQISYPVGLLGCALICALGFILSAVLFLRIKLGFEDKNNQKFLAESENRLKNPVYVQELLSYGYNIPEKYISGFPNLHE